MTTAKFEGGPLDGQFKEMNLQISEVIVREPAHDLTYWLDPDRHTYVFRGIRAWPGGPRPDLIG